MSPCHCQLLSPWEKLCFSHTWAAIYVSSIAILLLKAANVYLVLSYSNSTSWEIFKFVIMFMTESAAELMSTALGLHAQEAVLEIR